jgi:Arc/MetJ family transcription regulator
MRTNVVLEDVLMQNAKQACGCKTKKDTIESALRLLIKVKAQAPIKKFKGKLKWEGDLNGMRRN